MIEHCQHGGQCVQTPQRKASMKPCITSHRKQWRAGTYFQVQWVSILLRIIKTDLRWYLLKADCLMLEVILKPVLLQKRDVPVFLPVITNQCCWGSPGEKKIPVAFFSNLIWQIELLRDVKGWFLFSWPKPSQISPVFLSIACLNVLIWRVQKSQRGFFGMTEGVKNSVFFCFPCCLRALQEKGNPLWHSIFKLSINYFLEHFLK